jgi:putative ABC transport system ATP-binding protein
MTNASPNPQTVVSIKNGYKTYGKGEAAFTALAGIDLSIMAGESVAIVGKSGSGKSTLMHILALLDKPSQGAVFVDGEDASRLRGKQLYAVRNRRYGFVFQQFFLNGNHTVLNNVILPLQIAGVGHKECITRGLQALRSVDLEDKASSKAGELSGGQKQRVCIARALVNNPAVIFADEPTGNLDSRSGKQVEDLLFRLNQEHGITLIIVTHDRDLAARCQRQICIQDGHLTTKGTI